MTDRTHPTPTAADARRRLDDLRFELALAGPAGLTGDPAYMDDLADELATSLSMYVGLAVTEIATLRASLSGPLAG